ncbi:MAG: Ribonuclease toxin, BrnT, of type toxin-antitoxin system, partial [Firmicutes bacterium]|nr:Ribonuclease toxin, BrnT, of type toxin-antitoxin system [Bacillota bacterium]
MKLRFEWDEKKAKANLKKHRVDFDEATTVFTDKIEQLGDNDMRNEYDFRGGVRGKHHKA